MAVISTDESGDESADGDDEDDADEMERGLKRISVLKDGIREKKLKIETSKKTIADLKQSKKRKLAERSIVKEAFAELMVKQATYERYLRDVGEYIKEKG